MVEPHRFQSSELNLHSCHCNRGVEAVIADGKQYKDFFRSFEKAAERDRFIREAFEEVDRLGYSKEERAREAMAKIVEKVRKEQGTLKGEAKTFVNFLVAKVRRFIRNRLGFKNLHISEAEAYDIAVQALRRTGLNNSNRFFNLDRFHSDNKDLLLATNKNNDNIYDYTKTFAEQLNDFEQNKMKTRGALLVGSTPEVLRKIGFVSLPVTINQEHVGYALKGNYKGSGEEIKDHIIPKDELAKLPQKIADPVAIIQDKQLWKDKASEHVVDVLVTMKINGKDVLVPIRVGGRTNLNNEPYDSNVLTTIHGDKDTVERLINAINEDSNDNYSLYYLNKEKAKDIIQSGGNPIPTAIKKYNGFIHKLTDSNSPVKPRINSQTETLQFKRWFGDWQKNPKNASKVVDENGKPLIVYHGTDAEFDAFDQTKGRSGMDIQGMFFSPWELDAKGYGKNVGKFYLNMRNPADETTAYKALAKFKGQDYAGKKAREYLIKQGYDGVIFGVDGSPEEYIAFYPEQIKEASGKNIGTFDGKQKNFYLSIGGERAKTANKTNIVDEVEKKILDEVGEVKDARNFMLSKVLESEVHSL